MSILVFNAGSSSLRFSLFNEKLKRLYKGHIDAIGQKHCHYRRYFENGREEKIPIKAKNHDEAVNHALKRLQTDKAVRHLDEITKVAHRVVHGGESFLHPTLITPKVLRSLEKLSSLAPLHNPANLATVKASRKRIPKAKHVAFFDTAFHATLPERAFLYGLPFSLYKKQGIRRYGFHGISHEYVAQEAQRTIQKRKLKKQTNASTLIICHLGNGVSLTAIKNGKSMDTSMGFTPLEGPLMGTRSGSIDPAIIFHLAKKERRINKQALEKIHHLLEKESGFKGLSQIGSDIRSLWADRQSAGTRRTFDVFSYQVAKIILSYCVPLGGLPSTLVFTAGIGEHAFYLRKQICEYLRPFGVQLNPRANQKNSRVISDSKSKVLVLVIPTDEEYAMAKSLNKPLK